MRIITINLNGIRSAANKGFFAWLTQQDADIVCLQELKAQRFSDHAPLIIDYIHPCASWIFACAP